MAEIKDQWIEPAEYQWIVDNCPICTVDVVFFNETKDKVLLFKRANEPLKGEYFCPGGRLFKNEDLKAAARRQAKKELDLEINPDKLVFGGVINEVFPNSPWPKVNYHTVNIYWGYILSGEKIVLDQQHSHDKWFSVDDTTLHPYLQERIKNLLPKL